MQPWLVSVCDTVSYVLAEPEAFPVVYDVLGQHDTVQVL